MSVQVKLADPNEAYIIKNLYPLYLHDISGHYGLAKGPALNKHGIFEDSPNVMTLADQYEVQNIWWEKPGSLYPFLIRVNDMPAGFVLIAGPPYCPVDTDYYVNEFFLLQPFRGQGYAQQAAVHVFQSFRGKWTLYTNPSGKNIAGQKFWRRTVSNYAPGGYEESMESTLFGQKLVFRFHNGQS